MKWMTATGIVLLAIGNFTQYTEPTLSPVASVSAVGVLAWMAYKQWQELRELRESFGNSLNKVCESFDGTVDKLEQHHRSLTDKMIGILQRCQNCRIGEKNGI